MSKKRELLSHVNQLNGIRDIMGAMKNLAVLESHKLSNRLDNMREMVNDLQYCTTDFLVDYPGIASSSDSKDKIYVVFGSERGFCGDFNDKLIRFLDELENDNSGLTQQLVIVGLKLSSRLEADTRVLQSLQGASVAEDIGPVLDAVAAYLSALSAPNTNIEVEAIFQNLDTRDVERRQLLPPQLDDASANHSFSHSVDINLRPDELLSELLQHYLYVLLYEIAYLSLMAENHNRIQHMNGAIDKLDETCNDLTRRYHVEREEEITEEIEVILLNAIDLN